MRERQVHVPASTGLLRVRDIPGVETRGGHLNAESPQNQSVWSECVPLICSHSSHRPVGGGSLTSPGTLQAPVRLANACPKAERGKWWQRRGQDLSPLSPAAPLLFSLSSTSEPPAGPPTPPEEGVALRMSLTQETGRRQGLWGTSSSQEALLASFPRCRQPQARSASRHPPASPLQVRTRGGVPRVTQALFGV